MRIRELVESVEDGVRRGSEWSVDKLLAVVEDGGILDGG